MNKLVHELREARPSLRMVTPMSYYFVLIMAIFNIVLGFTLMYGIDKSRLSASLIIVNEFTSYTFWGIVFIALGLLKIYSLVTNNWWLSRKTLIFGVSIKAMWSVALIFRIFISPGSLFLTLCWLCIATLQMTCYIFFMPPNVSNYNQRRIDRE